MKPGLTVRKYVVPIVFLFLFTGMPTVLAVVEPGWPAGQRNTPRNPDDFFLDFEVGIDGLEIESTLPSLKFTTTAGLNWSYGDIRTGQYNVYPYGGKSYETNGNFFAWLGVTGDKGRVDFVGGGATYCSVLVSTYSGVTLDAYDDTDTLISTSGWATSNINTRTFTRLTVEAPSGKTIAYVMIHDTGNYWLMDDFCTDANKVVIPVPGRSIGKHKDRFDLIFVPDVDYGLPADIDTWLPTFIDHIQHQIDDRLGAKDPVTGNLSNFNFYYTRMQGTATSKTLPTNMTLYCPFADAYVIFHNAEFGDSTSMGKPSIYGAEGPVGRSFIHESGHGIFGLADEYDGCGTFYFSPSPNPNIWATQAAGRTDASGEYRTPVTGEVLGTGNGNQTLFGPVVNGNSGNPANAFFADIDIDGDVDNADVAVFLNGTKQSAGYAISVVNGTLSFATPPPTGTTVSLDYSFVVDEDWNPTKIGKFTDCQGDWWKLGTTAYIMFDGTNFANGWGKPGSRRIQWFLDQYPDAAEPTESSSGEEKSIWMDLQVNSGLFSLLEESLVYDSAPDYFPGDYEFKAKVFSTSGGLLGEFGINDPRRILAESDYQGPTWLENVNFQLILPYFSSGGRVDLIESETARVLLSVDISQYATGSPNQPPVANAGPDQTVEATSVTGTEVTLDGSGSTDSDGGILSYLWTENGNPIAEGESPIVTLSIGSHIITLTVTDDGGLTDTDTVVIIVELPPVDNLVVISTGLVSYDRRTGQYSTQIKVKNTSTKEIGEPVWLVIVGISNPGVTLASPDGTTADGKPYLNLSLLLGDGKLSPGETISKRIYFNNPSRVKFTFTPSVRGMVLEGPS